MRLLFCFGALLAHDAPIIKRFYKNKKEKTALLSGFYGVAGGIRTRDLLIRS